MRTIYLHIGRGKTGTSYIQGFLSRNRRILGKQGLLYPRTSEKGGGHQELAKSFVDPASYPIELPRNPATCRRRTLGEIRRSKASAIVISSENFAIGNVEKIAEYFNQLAGEFVPKILLFVRSQDELAESEYTQMVKLKGVGCSFETYAETMLEGCDYWQLAQQWESHFGRANVNCKIYDANSLDIVDESEYQSATFHVQLRSIRRDNGRSRHLIDDPS